MTLAESAGAKVTVGHLVQHYLQDDIRRQNPRKIAQQFKINPEINAKLEAFMRSEPGLMEFVKQIPREQLERKFLLRKMPDQQQKEGYIAKVKTWLEKPEQAEVLKAIRSMISPVMKPERQEQVIVNQAKNFIKNSGVKLS